MDMQIVTANSAECKSFHILKIQDGGRPPFWKSKTCNNSATVHPIATKFCRNMQIAIVKRTESENLNISKIPDGGRPAYWKSKIRNITSTVQPIKMKLQEHAGCHCKPCRK